MNMRNRKPLAIAILLFVFILVFSVSSYAIPTLQLGAPAGPGDSGIYADYQTSLTNPTESDSAVTGGSTLYAAGTFGPNTRFLGGAGSLNGVSWSWADFGYASAFDGRGALLMATVADGALGLGSLTVNGMNPIYTTSGYENGFVVPNPPANHDPIKDQDYLFFDIGNFINSGSVPNFVTETGSAPGEIKTLSIATSGYSWIHFDVFAIEADVTGGKKIRTTFDDVGNPGSKDVTWKENTVPEPTTLALMGLGLLGLAFARARK
jgi:hypothetical protein